MPLFFVTAGVVGYCLLAKIAARTFSLLCPVQTQNSDHSGQFLLYCLIQERSTHRAEIRLRWQVRANSTSSCNLFIQHKNSYFNLFCHEILKHTVVKEESVGRGCSNTYCRSLAMWEKMKETNLEMCGDTPRVNMQDRQGDLQFRKEVRNREEVNTEIFLFLGTGSIRKQWRSIRTASLKGTKPPSDLQTEMPHQWQQLNSCNGKIRQDLSIKVVIWNKVA